VWPGLDCLNRLAERPCFRSASSGPWWSMRWRPRRGLPRGQASCGCGAGRQVQAWRIDHQRRWVPCSRLRWKALAGGDLADGQQIPADVCRGAASLGPTAVVAIEMAALVLWAAAEASLDSRRAGARPRPCWPRARAGSGCWPCVTRLGSKRACCWCFAWCGMMAFNKLQWPLTAALPLPRW